MAHEEALAGLTLEDISVDEDGRVIITNPRIRERLSTAAGTKAAAEPITNNGCTVNTVKNCGCKLQ